MIIWQDLHSYTVALLTAACKSIIDFNLSACSVCDRDTHSVFVFADSVFKYRAV